MTLSMSTNESRGLIEYLFFSLLLIIVSFIAVAHSFPHAILYLRPQTAPSTVLEAAGYESCRHSQFCRILREEYPD